MSLSPAEKQFLARLAREHQGRTSYSLTDYEKAMHHLQGLIDRGFIRHRRNGIREGVQITEAGKTYLGGEV